MDADIPVIYTAVSDPVGAGLANEDGTTGGKHHRYLRQTSGRQQQLKMIRELLPDAKKIGILYTTSEANSCQHDSRNTRSMQTEYGFEIVDTGINTIADVEMAAR